MFCQNVRIFNSIKIKKLEQLATQLMAATKFLHTVQTEQDQNFYTNWVAQLEQQIDTLVEELYDLTEEEIMLIDAS